MILQLSFWSCPDPCHLHLRACDTSSALYTLPLKPRSPGGGHGNSLIHSSILSWRIPWTEEPGRLQSMGSQRYRHDWSDLAHSSLGCDKMQRKYRCAVGVDWTSLRLSLCTKTRVGWSHSCSSHCECSCTSPLLPPSLATHLRTVTPGSHLESFTP